MPHRWGTLIRVVLIGAGLSLSGCEDHGRRWVAPSDITGMWMSEPLSGSGEPFHIYMAVTQHGARASAMTWIVHESGTTTVGSRYAGTYASGVLSLDAPQSAQPFYYRFTSDTTMYRVIDPETDDRGAIRYTRRHSG